MKTVSSLSFIAFIALINLTFLNISEATPYYIDYQNGNDTFPGTLRTKPFRHCYGDSNAIGKAALVNFQGGDTIVFRGGSIYQFNPLIKDNISFNKSGLPEKPIVIISGHKINPPWTIGADTNRAVIDGTFADPEYSVRGGILDLKNSSNIIVDGLEVKNMTVNYGYLGCIYWRGDSGPDIAVEGNVSILDCVMHNSNSGCIVLQGNYEAGPMASTFLIKNCHMYDSWGHLAMVRYGIENVVIQNNSFEKPGSDPYNVGNVGADCITLAESGNNLIKNITIVGNDINYNTPIPTKSHILLFGTINNLIIKRNYFHGSPRVAAIDQTGPTTQYIVMNNIFDVKPTDFEGILRFFTDQGTARNCSELYVFNNTFVSIPRLGGIVYFFRGNDPDDVIYSNIQIKNNIFNLDTTDISKDFIYIGTNLANTKPIVDMSSFKCDYNIYNTTLLDNQFFAGINGLVSFSKWQAFDSSDKNSHIDPINFINELESNFMPKSSDTIAILEGANLSNDTVFNRIPEYNIDYSNIARSATVSRWTIGAFEVPAQRASIIEPHKNPKQVQSIQAH